MVALSVSAGITGLTGLVLWFITRNSKNRELRKRDGYLVVAGGWMIMTIFGMLPYLLSGAIPNPADAFFETMSGFSTTGATILTDIEAVHKGLLFWRSLTQWIGGMGIIVLAVAILPILGIGGMQLFVAEAPGISPDKLQPRIKETAKRLWFIYIGLTVLECIILWSSGLSFYDSINHAMTSTATGGFSPRNDSIAYFQSPFVHYVITIFMFLGGTNFTMIYFALHRDFRTVFKNEEFKTYSLVCLIMALIVVITLVKVSDEPLDLAIQHGLFQVVSIITTTGYVTFDYTAVAPFMTFTFFTLMFFGASAGSTSGGIKLVRHLILVKNGFLELKRQLHPSAVIPVRFNGSAVPRDITFNILAFIMVYLSIFIFGLFFVSALGVDFETTLGAVASCLGNVGPAIGSVGPVNNFAHLPDIAKWFLALLMLLGRLELFTVLILFTPFFWRKI